MTQVQSPAAHETIQPGPTPVGGPSDVDPPPTSVALATVTIVLTLLGWTTVPLFLRFFTHDIDAFTANGWRYAISALIWAPVLLYSWRKRTWPQGLWRAALIPSLWNAAAQVCFALAPYYITPGLMTFSLRLQIVFLALGAAIMFPTERRLLRSPAFLIALIVVVSATMATLALSPDGLGEGRLIGVLLAVGSGVMYAMYALGVRKNMMGMNPIKAFAAVSQYTAAILIVVMLFMAPHMGADAITHLTPYKFFLLILSSVIGIGLGHTFYFYSIARLGLVISAGVVQLQPITVSVASFFLFGERMTMWQCITGAMAVAGAVAMLVVQNRLLRTRPA